MTDIHPKIAAVTERIRQRSAETRADYLDMIRIYLLTILDICEVA